MIWRMQRMQLQGRMKNDFPRIEICWYFIVGHSIWKRHPNTCFPKGRLFITSEKGNCSSFLLSGYKEYQIHDIITLEKGCVDMELKALRISEKKAEVLHSMQIIQDCLLYTSRCV